MNATQKTARKPLRKSVTETLLELAYVLHATTVVGVREASEPSRPDAPSETRAGNEGSSLAS